MTDPTQPSAVDPLRLVLDFGEVVEVDGSELLDPVAEATVPAVVLRMPGHRADWFGKLLLAYTRVCELVGTQLDAAERSTAWALRTAAGAADESFAAESVARSQVTSAQRMTAAAALREREDFDDVTLIAVVDAAARWMDEPDGEQYAYALLGAVTDTETQGWAYLALAGRPRRSGDHAEGLPS